MIKLKKIAENLGYKTDDLETKFDDTKDIFFRTTDGFHFAILKLDKARSIFFEFESELDVIKASFSLSKELKNGKLDGCSIWWSEWVDYFEYKNGIEDGYCETAFQQKLSERGIYRNGKKEGWWEFGNKYEDIEYGRKDFYELKDYRPAGMQFFSKGLELGSFYPTDSTYQYENAVNREYGSFSDIAYEYKDDPKKFDKLKKSLKKSLISSIKEEVEKEGIYKGDHASYISYATYLKITNLSKLKPPGHPESWGGAANSINYYELEQKYCEIIEKKVSIKNFTIDNIRFGQSN